MSYPSIYSLPHQKAVINQLVASCPKQRGLLVAHQMGGGKTLTALMMFRNYPKSKHIIVCPSFLKDLYDRESVIVFGKPLLENTVILDYEEFKIKALTDEEFFKDAILAMDEAHYLVPIFETLDMETFEKLYFVLLTQPKKCLLLTGTPVYNSSNDLRLLVNIAAGKEILPFRETDFMREFTVPRKSRAAFWGQFMPTLNTIVNYGKWVPYANYGRHVIRTKIDDFRGADDAKKLKNQERVANAEYTYKVVGTQLMVLNMFLIMANSFASNMGPMFFRKYDYDKIKQRIGPYVSSFKLKPGTLGIPETKQVDIHVLYTAYQTRMLTRMWYNELTTQDILDLGILKKDATQAAFIGGSKIKEMNVDKYKDVGRMISNTSEIGTYPRKFEKCFANIVSDAQTPQFTVVYSEFEAAHARFMEFLQFKKDSGTRFTFTNITAKHTPDEKSRILNDFREGNINVLVVGVGMYEGISILRASQFHILDPPKNYKDVSQLYGRVVRLHSHEGLPRERQLVTYFNYVGILDTNSVDLPLLERLALKPEEALNKSTMFAEKFKLYKESLSYKYTTIGLYNAPITAGVTAEYLAFSAQEPLRELMKELSKLLEHTTVLPKMLCCPTYETNGISEDCLLTHVTIACLEE